MVLILLLVNTAPPSFFGWFSSKKFVLSLKRWGKFFSFLDIHWRKTAILCRGCFSSKGCWVDCFAETKQEMKKEEEKIETEKKGSFISVESVRKGVPASSTSIPVTPPQISAKLIKPKKCTVWALSVCVCKWAQTEVESKRSQHGSQRNQIIRDPQMPQWKLWTTSNYGMERVETGFLRSQSLHLTSWLHKKDFICTMVWMFVPPNSVCWNPNLQGDGSLRWGPWEVMRLWGQSLHKWD